MKQKFFICRHCGNIIAMIRDKGVPIFCCGEKMHEIAPGTTEASEEKHIPVYEIQDNVVHVTVGSVEHPMSEEHRILWVCLQTDKGIQRKCLEIGKAPIVTFALFKEKPISVSAY